MRKLSTLALLAAAVAPSAAVAAPQPCSDQVTVDCLKDDVLLIGGDMIISGCKKGTKECSVDYRAAVAKALTVIGPVDIKQWDQFVIFAQEAQQGGSNPAGPLFYREGYTDESENPIVPAKTGVNEVDRIGLPVIPRVAGRPFVGWVAAGGTHQPGTNPVSGQFSGCGRNATSDQSNPGLCYSGLYNYFDALAQATGSMFGPYLAGPKDATAPVAAVPADPGDPGDPMAMPPRPARPATPGMPAKPAELLNPLSVVPTTKGGLVPVAEFPKSWTGKVQPQYTGVRPRIWNSFLDTGGSIMGGSTFRDNGNGTFETTKPAPFYGINVPFSSSTWKPGHVMAGSQILRFQPLDLYAMGFIDATELPTNFRSFIHVAPGTVYRPMLGTAFVKENGPTMGLRTGVALRPGGMAAEQQITSMSILAANGGPRSPGFAQANHYIKQLWVVVLKPAAMIDEAAAMKADAEEMEKELKKVRDDAAKAIDNVTIWRHQFPAYFYMLAQYKGRVVTTFDGVDDNAYWEFNQKIDDEKMFKAENATVVLNGNEAIPNSSDLKNVLRFQNSGGEGGGVHYDPAVLKLRIPGNQDLKAPYNSVAVRMRVPSFVPKNSFATITFKGPNGGPSIRIPSNCGTPARANCKESAFLVNDGKWRTYSATLSGNDEFTGATFDGFFFQPSNQAFNNDNPDDGIEVEFIRIANVASPKDVDLGCTACADCGKLTDAASKTACTKACSGKEGSEKVSFAQPDGWIDSEDNCPNHYNPLQEDGNDDGVGDACEDFDGDGVVNSCDNCPTTTNSRQRDQDGNGVGDVCDGSQETPCFLAPDSLAGPVSSPPGLFLGVMFGGVIGLLAYRRRRSR